jgi:hypothetical protein
MRSAGRHSALAAGPLLGELSADHRKAMATVDFGGASAGLHPGGADVKAAGSL